MNDVIHEVRPLAAYIEGNLRLLMRSGEHVLRIDEEAAHKLRVAFDRGEPADSVLRGSFLQIDPNALDAMEWIADSRQPSTESRIDRELRRLGGDLFRGGWLRTLYDLAPADAAYSVAGLVAWKSAAMLLVIDRDEIHEALDRRDVLSALARLWDNVADPEDMQVRDFADVYTDILKSTEPKTRPEQESADEERPGSERAHPHVKTSDETEPQVDDSEQVADGDDSSKDQQ